MAKELTLSVLEDVSRRKFDAVPNTPARGAEGTSADLQATASAADLSNNRWFDDSMARFRDFTRFQLAVFSSIFIDFRGFHEISWISYIFIDLFVFLTIS